MKILNKEINDELVKEVGKFTILWANFEEKYCNTRCSPEKILKLDYLTVENKQFLKNLAECLLGRFDLSEEEFIGYNLIPEKADKPKKDVIEKINDYIILERYSVEGALLLIYRVRNNLMHGLKSCSDLDGQIDLFKAINDILENIEKKIDI